MSETCANCGHEEEIHGGATHICYETFCKCEKFIPQNHSPTEINLNSNLGVSPIKEDPEPEGKYDKPMCPKNDTSGSGDNLKVTSESLSDKIWCEETPHLQQGLIPVKDVKESVQKLKEDYELNEFLDVSQIILLCKRIDKIFGKELI